MGVVLAGTYRLARVIGRGGMGRLYAAEHTRLDRRFAVKVLHESHADKPDAVARFEREANALARIRSDHVLDVVDVLRTPDGRTAIVTALLEGEDLQQRLDRGRMPIFEAIAVARQICRGLAAAHAVGVVHRDLKPSNLFLAATPDGRIVVKILDFGVAKLAGEDAMTRTGVVLGTPAYMAPEQARGSAEADARSDLYAVGAVLYRMVTGRMPYEGADPGATLARLLREAPPRPRAIAPDVPIALEVVIQRAMAREPEERPASALELDRALAELDESGDELRAAPLSRRPQADGHDPTARPNGATTRREEIERSARRARPVAALLASACAIGAGAGTAGFVAAAGALVATTETHAALVRALAIVGAVAIASAAGIGAARTLGPRWSSAPAVEHASERLRRALVAGLVCLGAALLCSVGASAIEGAEIGPRPTTLLGALSLAALASLRALRDKTATPAASARSAAHSSSVSRRVTV